MTSIDKRGKLETDPFTYRVTKSGMVFIERGGIAVTTLKGRPAEQFLAKIEPLEEAEAQVLMAKATGNYKRGNER